jgi:hypothetical protein
VGRPVRDLTPQGAVLPHHQTVQIIPTRDVTKACKPATVLPLLRGLLHDLPYRCVGLLTHQHLAKALPDLLREPYRGRLAQVSYFGGGMDRGSNAWIGDGACDALIILGTPRVGGDAVRLHLRRLGKRRAANRSLAEIGWEADWWSGVTAAGRRVTVRCWHYVDHDWHAAYCSLVRSELVQAAGRGRGILPEGIPVFVVSTENLAPLEDGIDARNGFPLAEPGTYGPLTEAQGRVLATLYDGRGEPVVRKLGEIARALGISTVRVHKLLSELRTAERVEHVGRRGGWTPK